MTRGLLCDTHEAVPVVFQTCTCVAVTGVCSKCVPTVCSKYVQHCSCIGRALVNRRSLPGHFQAVATSDSRHLSDGRHVKLLSPVVVLLRDLFVVCMRNTVQQGASRTAVTACRNQGLPRVAANVARYAENAVLLGPDAAPLLTIMDAAPIIDPWSPCAAQSQGQHKGHGMYTGRPGCRVGL